MGVQDHYFSAGRWTSTGLPTGINEQFDRIGADGWELVGTDSIIRPSWFGSATTVGVIAYGEASLRQRTIGPYCRAIYRHSAPYDGGCQSQT
jgi:hypothetical protein